jgi:hypothetical protein
MSLRGGMYCSVRPDAAIFLMCSIKRIREIASSLRSS